MKKLTDELREKLREPFGEVMSAEAAVEKVRKRKGTLISVGDACGVAFIKAGIEPDIIIYDLKIRRKEVPEETKAVLENAAGKSASVPNEASTINPLLEGAVKRALKGKTRKIFVEGNSLLFFSI